jgi:multiple sugar transport system substrate-binding protein
MRGGQGSTNQLVNGLVAYVGIDHFWGPDGSAALLRHPLATEYTDRFAAIQQNRWSPDSTLIHNLGSYENQRQTFTDDQYAFVPFPISPTGQLAEQVGSVKGICISVNSNNFEAAWEYVKWNASEHAISAINEAVGELPTRVDSAGHAWVRNAPHMSNLPTYAATDKVAVFIPTYLPDYGRINREWAEPNFQRVLYGQMSAADFLNGWADLLEPPYAEYRRAMGL